MKKLAHFLFLICLAIRVWASDDLKPEPTDKAIKEYQGFWKASNIDSMNHEVWKLYIFGRIFQKETQVFGGTGVSGASGFMTSPSSSLILIPKSDYNTTPNSLLAGLGPKPGLFVLLQINNLYNFYQPIPKPGDVIVIEGRVLQKVKGYISCLYKEEKLDALSFYAEDGMKLENEHFDLPDDEMKIISTSPQPTPTLAVTPTISSPDSENNN